MMRKILIAAAICAAMLVGSSVVAVANFDVGVAAYDRGDYKAALREFRVSAAQGDARAQYNLGVMYRKGNGVARDYQEADRWYRNAAELGHAGAQFSLGLMYREGLIGKMYVKGQGIKKNYVKAHKWFNIAASNGHQSSRESMGIVEEEMTPDDIAKARTLAQEWMHTWPIVVQGLDYSQQKSFEKTMTRACFKKQKSMEINSGFEDWQMEEYCDCSARYVSSRILVSDFVHLAKRKNFNRRTRDLVEIAGQKCMAQLKSKWGFK
jgi:TPR repeat protein